MELCSPMESRTSPPAEPFDSAQGRLARRPSLHRMTHHALAEPVGTLLPEHRSIHSTRQHSAHNRSQPE